MHNAARFFVILGLIFLSIGLVLLLFPKFPIFKLPGDVVLKKDGVILIFPIATGIILSIVLTLILNLLLRK
ncbi:MAG: DUF2905 domain-containing protein [candidate division WOR-3 bacterium]|nr:MAG: DUF2905 domain-containing protein [candidate division WOR-3 bacterium]